MLTKNYFRPRKPKRTIELDVALVEARHLIGQVPQGQVGNRGKGYATADDIIEAIEDAMHKCQLLPSFSRIYKPDLDLFKTEITHAPTGQKRREIRKFEPDTNGALKGIHAEKSAETYYRRMGLINLLCLRQGNDKESSLESHDNDSQQPDQQKDYPISKAQREIESLMVQKGDRAILKFKELMKKFNQTEIRFLKPDQKEHLLVELQHL
jgi:hypothetical protein